MPPIVAVPPVMKTSELRVATSVGTDDLTPAAGKHIRVWGIFLSLTVTTALTATLRATLAFGTGHTADATKILASFRGVKGDDARGLWIGGINRIGAADEVVRLTNITYSSGAAIVRTIVYYTED